MTNEMIREEAIAIIQNECTCVMKASVDDCNRNCNKCELVKPTNEILEAMCMAISALEQMPEVTSTMQTGQFDYVKESCDDAVSRDAVIEILDNYGCTNKEGLLFKDIRDLPSVTVRQTGHWIEKDGYDGDVYYDCSVCGESWTTIEGTPWDNEWKFCPNCGCRMVKEEGAE